MATIAVLQPLDMAPIKQKKLFDTKALALYQVILKAPSMKVLFLQKTLVTKLKVKARRLKLASTEQEHDMTVTTDDLYRFSSKENCIIMISPQNDTYMSISEYKTHGIDDDSNFEPRDSLTKLPIGF